MLNLNTYSSEIKLSYQLYGEKNTKPQDAILFSPSLEQRFAQDVIDDLVNKGLWNETLEAQLENKQLYFKVFRDDEDMIPVDAIEFENIRMLPNRGLLGLEEPLQNALSRSANWFGSFIPESIKQTAYDFGNSFAQWTVDKLMGLSAYSSIPKVNELDEDVWQERVEDNGTESELLHFAHSDTEENTDQTITTTSSYYLDSILTTAWHALTYAANNPLKTLILALAASSVVNRVHLPKMKFENPSLDFTKGVTTATNILTKLAVAKIVTNGMHSSTPLNTMIAGMSLWDPAAATTPEFQVNTYTTAFQSTPSVTSFADGSFVVTWESAQEGTGAYGVYGQRFVFVTTVEKIGPEFQVNTYTTNNQHHSFVASFANGSFVVTWQSDGQDGSSYGIYGQRFNATGIKIGSEFPVNTYTTQPQINPPVASFVDNSFVVTWQSNQDGSGNGVYGQLFNVMGAKVGSELQVNTYTTSNQNNPLVASFLDSSFVVTWQSYQQDGADFGVYGQRFNSAGAKIGPEFLVNTYTTGYQGYAFVVSFVDNSFVVTWMSDGQDGSSYGIYGQRFNATGVKIGSEFQVNTYTTNNQNYPSVATFLDSSFVVTWQSYQQDGSLEGIYGQRFNATGSKIGSEFQVNIYTTNSQDFPYVTSFADGSFVVTWQSSGQDGSSYGVYGRIFTPPHLNNNTLIISEGQTKLITSSMLSASVLNTTLGTLGFTISNMMRGQFEWVSSPGVPISSFTQQQITASQIQFVHDGSEFAPAYQVKVNEAVLDTTPASAQIIFTNINDAPVLTGSGGTLAFVEKNTAKVVDGGIVIFDVDSPTLSSATIRFTNPTMLPEDVLSFTIQGGISGAYSNATGILFLNGTASVSNYQQALRNITYFNPSLDPSAALRTVAFTVNDGQLNSNTVSRSITVTPVNDPPVLTVNTLTITGGQSLTLTSAELQAIDPDTADSSLTFMISAIQFCRFERISTPGVAITTFTQQDINTNQIRLVATGGSVSPPAYQVSVSDGQYSTPPVPASVNFDGGFVPSISANKLTISQGGVVILTSNQLNALDGDTSPSALIFTASNIRHGSFSLVSDPASAITAFTLQNIISGSLQFTHDGSENAPSYDMSVSDGLHTTSTQAATISYTNVNQAPVVLNIIPDRSSEKVDQTFLFQVAANTFFDSDPGDQAALVYSSKMRNGNALPTWISFDVVNRQFIGKPVAVGQTQISVFARDPSNAVGVANFTMDVSVIPPVTTPKNTTLENALIGAGVSALVGFIAFALKYGIRRASNKKLQTALAAKENELEKQQRQYDDRVIKPIASHIHANIKIAASFESVSTAKVNNFIMAVQTLASEMNKAGIRYEDLSEAERNTVHRTIVKELKYIAHPNDTNCCTSLMRCGFFKADITPQQIEENAEKLVKAINKALNRTQFNVMARVTDPKHTQQDIAAQSIELKPIPATAADATSSKPEAPQISTILPKLAKAEEKTAQLEAEMAEMKRKMEPKPDAPRISTILPKLAKAEEKAIQAEERATHLEAEMADMKKQMAQLLSAQTGSPVHAPVPTATSSDVVASASLQRSANPPRPLPPGL